MPVFEKEKVLKRKFTVVAALILVTNLTACTAVKDKFVRKKDEEKKEEMYLDLKFYEESSGAAFYKKSFIFAKGWLEEVQKELEYGSNLKRMKVRMDDALAYVGHMKSYLSPQGLDNTKLVWDELAQIRQEIDKPYFVGSRKQAKLAERLEDAIRLFVKQCSVDKLEDYILE